MNAEQAQAAIDAWRDARVVAMDPIRVQRIDALLHRARMQQGAVRELLLERLVELIDGYAHDVAALAPGADVRDAVGPRRSTGLAALVERFERRDALQAPAGGDTAIATETALDEVRRLSAQVRTESQVRQALGHAPENAGPLNSASLVHRALGLMRDVAPEYLQAFMAYADTLARLDAMAPTPQTPGANTTTGRPARRRKANAAS